MAGSRGRASAVKSVESAPSPPPDKAVAILDAAQTLFSRYGFRRTSIDDLARAAGIAKGTVYLYFATKEAIFRALCEKLIATVLRDAAAAADADGSVGERVTAVLQAKIGFFHALVVASPHAAELLDSNSRLGADLFAAADARYLAILTRVLEQAERRREISLRRAGTTATGLAELLFTGAHGAATDPRGAPTPRAFERRLQELVRVVLRSVTD